MTVNLCRFLTCLSISVLSLEIQLPDRECSDSINWFNPAIFLCLCQAREEDGLLEIQLPEGERWGFH